LADFPRESLQVIEGISAITLIFDQKLFDDICSAFPERSILDKKRNLATLIIQSPDEIINTSGCVAAFYNAVSRRHINIEETMSCSTDTIILLRMEDVSKAFEALKELITEARKTDEIRHTKNKLS
jgi:hypothetical protein